MTTSPLTPLLCKFAIDPFPDMQQARELLSGILEREVSNADFERGIFCFQIAFYFLAWLAVLKHVENKSLKKTMIDSLHKQIRAYFSHTDRKVRFFDFILSATERDMFVKTMNSTTENRIDISRLTTNHLKLFDVVFAYRFKLYYDASLRASPHAFYFVAEQVLDDVGVDQNPAKSFIISNMMQRSFSIAKQLVAVASPALDIDSSDEWLGKYEITRFIPDITKTKPIASYSAGTYILLLCRDVDSIGGANFIPYKYVIAAIDRRSNRPMCYVTLENSPLALNVLSVIEGDGSLANFGPLAEPDLELQFVTRGVELLKERLKLGPIERMAEHVEPRPR